MALRVAVVSTAEIGRKVAPAIAASDHAELVAIASRDPSRAEEFASTLEWGENASQKPAGLRFVTYDEILKDDTVDALYVPLPSALRNDFLKRAIASGKHVYAEKPLDGSVEEVQELLDATREKNVQWIDGTMWVHSKRTKDIEKRLEAGEIGTLRRVIASFTFMAPDEQWLNGGNGRTDKTREPMGCFGDQGWYPVGAIMWAFRYEKPERVQMLTTKLNKVDTIIEATGIIHFAGGRVGLFDTGACR
jgi:D-xylose 1-dehydrogenase (NADP+, D-xylono-1,5-lactone-forming)